MARRVPGRVQRGLTRVEHACACLGETVLRVKDLARMKAFYSRIIGLELMKELDGIARVVSLASIYVADPEQDIVELVCYDPSVE